LRTAAAWFSRHEYLAAVIVLGAVLCLWFAPAFTGKHLGQDHILFDLVPWSSEKPAALTVERRSSEGDAATAFRPSLEVARDAVRAGRLPYWNPNVSGGNELLGNMQAGLLFPLTWIAFVTPLGAAWGVIAILKLLIAGLGTYTFARQVRVGRGGALVAGVVYMLCVPNLVWLQWPHVTVFALFPWLMVVTDRLFRTPNVANGIWVGVVVAASVLAGHPESAILGSLCAGVYLVGLLLFDGGAARVSERLKTAGWWLVGHAVGMLAAAVALLPFLEAYRHSTSRAAHAFQTGQALPLHRVLFFVMPTVYGDGQPQVFGEGFAGFTEVAGYFGLVALLLAGAAAWRKRSRRDVRAFALMTVVVGMILFGIPPMDLAAQHLWPLEGVVIGRMYVYLAFAGAIGAGAAVSVLSGRKLPLAGVALWATALLAVVAAIYAIEVASDTLTAPVDVREAAVLRFAKVLTLGVLCLVALGRIRAWAVVPLVVVVCVLDLSFMRGYNVWLPPDQATPPTPRAVNFLQQQDKPFRISSVGTDLGQDVLPPNTPSDYALESVEGRAFPQSLRWTNFATIVLGQQGLTPERFHTNPVPGGASLKALQMLNVRYYMTAPRAPSPHPTLQLVYEGPDANVYADSAALPRAYVVPTTRPVDDANELMADGDVDLRRVALVPSNGPAIAGGSSEFRPARVTQITDDRLRVTVPPGPPGLLVVANAYAPQWRASVDGREVSITPTNSVALGVPISSREAHSVELHVSHRSFWLGAAISLVALTGMVAVLVRSRGNRASVDDHSSPL
jgi:hypothetical protein